MILKRWLCGIAFVALVALGLLGMHGAFNTVVVTEQNEGPYEFVYRVAPQADYGAVREITTEMEEMIRVAGIHGMRPFDIYFPPGSAHGSEVGFVVRPEDVETLSHVANPPLHRTIPSARYLTATFPYMSPMSFIVGFRKVDSEFRDYRAANHLKQTWAATLNKGSSILYLQPVER